MHRAAWREKLRIVIFKADTPGGKAFDVALIICICLSVLVVMLESVAAVQTRFKHLLIAGEWFFTVLFSIEYILRLICVHRPRRYALSFFGIVDLVAVLPTYVSFFFPWSRYLLAIRILRLLRIFRVFKLATYMQESRTIITALQASRRKISVFLFAVVTIVVTIGALMYAIEGTANGFGNIPICIYWAIVTLTTVGYGDLTPHTALGKALASIVMILGYAIIAVPTGIVTAEMAYLKNNPVIGPVCSQCGAGSHEIDALYCKQCGARLAPDLEESIAGEETDRHDMRNLQ
jgi:voltage-gated potassium channel